jgi:hypothetical protein
MTTVGMVNTIHATTLMDKVQSTHQKGEDNVHVFAQEKVAQNELMKQSTVTESPEGEKADLKTKEKDKKTGKEDKKKEKKQRQ